MRLYAYIQTWYGQKLGFSPCEIQEWPCVPDDQKEGGLINSSFMTQNPGKYKECLRYIRDFKLDDIPDILDSPEAVNDILAAYNGPAIKRRRTLNNNSANSELSTLHDLVRKLHSITRDKTIGEKKRGDACSALCSVYNSVLDPTSRPPPDGRSKYWMALDTVWATTVFCKGNHPNARKQRCKVSTITKSVFRDTFWDEFQSTLK